MALRSITADDDATQEGSVPDTVISPEPVSPVLLVLSLFPFLLFKFRDFRVSFRSRLLFWFIFLTFFIRMMPSVSSIVFALSALVASVSAHPVSAHHEHVERAALPTDWYHPQGHASSSLFRRQDQPVAQLPKVGTPGELAQTAKHVTESVRLLIMPQTEWKAKYPSPEGALNSDETTLPKAWVDAYKAALANGLIPQVPPTVLVQDQNYNTQPTYPAGFDASSPEVCSSTVQCYNATDIVKAPDGFVGACIACRATIFL